MKTETINVVAWRSHLLAEKNLPKGLALISNALFVFFAGVALAALGLLSIIGMVALTRWFTVLVARYVRFNARIIMERKKEE